MTDLSVAEPMVPRKRVFAPEPTIERTHLYGSHGPLAWICVHARNGVLMAFTARTPHWSHGGSLAAGVLHHPDLLRVAFAWTGEREARTAMTAISSYADFEPLSFHEIRCDVAQSRNRGDFVHVDETPQMHVSIEACHEGPLRRFPRLPEHRLDVKMRRLPKPPGRISIHAGAQLAHA